MALIKDREWKQEAAYHTDHGFVLSMGNRKMGRVMSFSLPPIVTCNKKAPCTHDCYAVKMEKIYPTVKNSWQNNLELLNKYWGTDFVNDIDAAIRKKKIDLFRWFVGGDIPAVWFIDNMVQIAKDNPDVSFWCFTKQFDHLAKYRETVPDNLTFILSVWPPLVPSDDLKEKYGCCYFQDKAGSYSVPEDAYVCQGDCEECQVCTYLGSGESVVIMKH